MDSKIYGAKEEGNKNHLEKFSRYVDLNHKAYMHFFFFNYVVTME